MSGENTTVISIGYVGPNTASGTQLGPGFYSLNKRSNVPFVGLVGSAGFRKTISWGEICEIPKGQLVTVHNLSYHGGDIFMNKGRDICNRPSRITVPVRYTLLSVATPELTQPLWTADYPCDTRAAKRAYLNVDAYVTDNDANIEGITAFIRGRQLGDSMNCENSLQYFPKPWGPGVGFLSAINYGVNNALTYVPLGQGALQGDDTRPHNLLSAGDVFFLFNGAAGSPLGNFLTWPADRDVFGYPQQQAPGPGTWYVIEYD